MSSIKLSKRIETHKGPVSELEIGEVTARSFVQHGQPFKIRTKDGEFEIDFEDKATMGFLADATGHDALVLSALTAPDYMKARVALAHSILGIAGESPTKQ